eukprot:1913508-Lingulodinium_polyedra.AAC.1
MGHEGSCSVGPWPHARACLVRKADTALEDERSWPMLAGIRECRRKVEKLTVGRPCGPAALV